MALPAVLLRYRCLPALLCWLLSVWLLWLKPAGEPSGLPYGDKIGHFVLFALWAASLLYAMPARVAAWRKTLLLCLAWAVVSELGQALTATRSAELADALADMAGASLAVYLYYRWQR